MIAPIRKPRSPTTRIASDPWRAIAEIVSWTRRRCGRRAIAARTSTISPMKRTRSTSPRQMSMPATPSPRTTPIGAGGDCGSCPRSARSTSSLRSLSAPSSVKPTPAADASLNKKTATETPEASSASTRERSSVTGVVSRAGSAFSSARRMDPTVSLVSGPSGETRRTPPSIDTASGAFAAPAIQRPASLARRWTSSACGISCASRVARVSSLGCVDRNSGGFAPPRAPILRQNSIAARGS